MSESEFKIEMALPVRHSASTKWSVWVRVLNRLAHHLAVVLQNGRALELQAKFKEIPGNETWQGGWVRVDYCLVWNSEKDA